MYDALDALKLSIGLESSGSAANKPYQLIAADINQDGSVSVYDALDILKIAIDLQTNNIPQWVFIDKNNMTAIDTITSSNVNYTEGLLHENISGDFIGEFEGILLGDVDMSYTKIV